MRTHGEICVRTQILHICKICIRMQIWSCVHGLRCTANLKKQNSNVHPCEPNFLSVKVGIKGVYSRVHPGYKFGHVNGVLIICSRVSNENIKKFIDLRTAKT